MRKASKLAVHMAFVDGAIHYEEPKMLPDRRLGALWLTEFELFRLSFALLLFLVSFRQLDRRHATTCSFTFQFKWVKSRRVYIRIVDHEAAWRSKVCARLKPARA